MKQASEGYEYGCKGQRMQMNQAMQPNENKRT